MPVIRDCVVNVVELPLRTPFHTSLRSAYSVTDIRVELYTDNGYVGIGSASPTAKITGETRQSIETALREFILPTVTEVNLDEAPLIFESIARSIVGNNAAKAAVDIALHDLLARINESSLSDYLNGRPLYKIPTDATVSLNTPEAMENQALNLIDSGFHALKVKLGGRDGLDMVRMQRIRQALDADIPVRVDANQGWDVKESITYAVELAKLGIEFIEQPVYMKNIAGLAEVRHHSPLPIAADESVFDRYDLKRILDMDAADIINLKLMKTGGISPAIPMIRDIKAAGLSFMVGSMMEGPASVSAAAALACAFESKYVDLDAAYFLAQPLALGSPDYHNGSLCFDNGIGVGVTFSSTMAK